MYGLGQSGRAAIKLLKQLDANVSFFDDNVKFFDYIGFERQPKQKWDLVVISPGIKCRSNQLLQWLEEQHVPVISEIDLAYLCCRGKIIAITGTNGKTTVSMLAHRILKMAGKETFLCGNVGLPFSAICQKTTKNSITVCEVSNFQLETSRYFRPNVAAILNVKPDHLDRHGSFAEYLRVKCKITQNMHRSDTLVLNLDDDVTKKLDIHKRTKYFSKTSLKHGTSVWRNQIYYGRKKMISVGDIPLRGEKNLENVLAAVAVTAPFGVEAENAYAAIKNFVLAGHRMEKVGTLFGVTFIDDSKATNVASTVACLQAFAGEDIWLLMGGQGKEIDFDDLFKIGFDIKRVICFGQEAEKISKSAQKFAYNTAVFAKMQEAVEFCMKNAQEDDFVILSPACASFDEFDGYAARGEAFKKIVLGQVE